MHRRPCPWWTTKNKKILTFSQFVNCILIKAKKTKFRLDSRKAANVLDMHWMPQVHLSLPCKVEYNLIAKYDKFRESAKYIIQLLKLNSTLPERNVSERGNMTTGDYIRQLNVTQLKDIQMLYKYDFSLFGFDTVIPA